MKTYEEYWKITFAYTDFNDEKFLAVLKESLDFIDEHNGIYSKELYADLQNRIRNNPLTVNHKKNKLIAFESVRKATNQLVKMGFISPFLSSYTSLARDYLEAKTNKKRKTILSKIIYNYSSFNSSVTKSSGIRQINFLIRTLTEHPKGKLNKDEISALMFVDLEKFSRDFLTESELKIHLNNAKKSGFINRKYNQISYLYNLLSKLDNLTIIKDELYFSEDAERIFGKDDNLSIKKRDPYLHRLYKNQLQEECEEHYGNAKCMIEKLAYPSLVASHIKPFIESNDTEAYDPNNGLLLSRTLDSLFDLKYISFDDDGNMLKSKRLSEDVWQYWKNFKLDKNLLNSNRRKYLEFHRNLMTLSDNK